MRKVRPISSCRRGSSAAPIEETGIVVIREVVDHGTTAAEVVAIVDWLEEHGVVHQINGGWAVDALVGLQTRSHRDVDIFLDEGALDAACCWLAERGYVTETDWLPARIEMRCGAQRVDLHPLTLDADGNGLQRGRGGAVIFCHPAVERTIGLIDGRAVIVATEARLRQLHTGYEPREVDFHDVALLDHLTH